MAPLLGHRLRSDSGFERIYQRHAGNVYRYALAVLRNPADAEDVTQTTFLNAYRAYERGERPRSAQNWLIAIAHNVCRQRFRQSQRRVDEVTFDENLGDGIPEDEESPTAEDIRRALSQLAFNQRAALVMRELEGRSYVEIAEILDVSVSAVETLIFRARRALREQLEGALTCRDAELAISRQLDGRLPRPERGALRAHLRACRDCATLARKQRAQRAAIRGLAAVPLPPSLASFFGGSAGGATAAAVGSGVAAKAAAVAAATAVAGGAAYEGAKRTELLDRRDAPAAAMRAAAAPRAVAPAPRVPDAAVSPRRRVVAPAAEATPAPKKAPPAAPGGVAVRAEGPAKPAKGAQKARPQQSRGKAKKQPRSAVRSAGRSARQALKKAAQRVTRRGAPQPRRAARPARPARSARPERPARSEKTKDRPAEKPAERPSAKDEKPAEPPPPKPEKSAADATLPILPLPGGDISLGPND